MSASRLPRGRRAWFQRVLAGLICLGLVRCGLLAPLDDVRVHENERSTGAAGGVPATGATGPGPGLGGDGDGDGGAPEAGGGQGGEPPMVCESNADCNDGNPCTLDECTRSGACVWTEAASLCDDGDPCTPLDACIDGQCVGLTQFDCGDFSSCTASDGEPTCNCDEGFVPCAPAGGESVCIPEGTCCTDVDCASVTSACPAPGGSCHCTENNPVDCGGVCYPVCCPGSLGGGCGLCGQRTCNAAGTGYSCVGALGCSGNPPSCEPGKRSECFCPDCTPGSCAWSGCF